MHNVTISLYDSRCKYKEKYYINHHDIIKKTKIPINLAVKLKTYTIFLYIYCIFIFNEYICTKI